MTWRSVFASNPVTRTWYVRWMQNQDEGELEKKFTSLDAAMKEARMLQHESGPMRNAYIFVEHGRRPNRAIDLLMRFNVSWGIVTFSPEADQWLFDNRLPPEIRAAERGESGSRMPPGFDGFGDEIFGGEKGKP